MDTWVTAALSPSTQDLSLWHGNSLLRDLVPWAGTELGPPALGAWSLSHWTTREGPWIMLLWTVQLSHSVVSDSLPLHGLQHARPPYPSPTPRDYSNSRPLGWLRHPTISSSVIPFSRLHSFPASGSFLVSQFFSSGSQSIGVSASAAVLPVNIRNWFPLE